MTPLEKEELLRTVSCQGKEYSQGQTGPHLVIRRKIRREYLVSIVKLCSPPTLRRGKSILQCLPKLDTSSANGDEILSILSVLPRKIVTTLLYYLTLLPPPHCIHTSLPRQNHSVY